MRPPTGMRGLTLFTAWMILTGVAAAQGEELLPGNLRLTDRTLAPNHWVHGMIEHRFSIENPTAQTQPVQITLPGYTDSGKGIAALSQSVLANAETRTQALLHQPPARLLGSDISVRVGRHRAKTLSSRSIQISSPNSYYSSECPLSLLVSKGLSAEELKACLIAIAPEDTGRGGGYSRDLHTLSSGRLMNRLFTRTVLKELNPFRFEGEGAAWPRHWLAYSAFDGCLIAAADFDRMPDEARRALRDYAAIGGQVTFLGTTSLPDGWPTRANAAPPRPTGFSSGAAAEIGFGRVSAMEAGSFPTVTSNDLWRLTADWIEAVRPWLNPHDSISDNLAAIPVAGNVRVPARSFLVILLVFALLAGPGAVRFTRRANRRIWLLALVPAFALLFSLVIVAYALLSEGITPSLRRQAITLLDQSHQHAATFGALGIYAPISLRDGLHFDPGTEITPLSPVNSGKILIGRGQHYASGWVQPRLPAFFRLRRSETRAERLMITSAAPGMVEVVNAMGAPILRLQLCDHEGNLYETRALGPGDKRTLASTGQRLSGELAATHAFCLYGKHSIDAGWNLSKLVEDLLDEKAKPPALDAGSYVAVLDGAPFLENPLAYCQTKHSARSIVMGWYNAE